MVGVVQPRLITGVGALEPTHTHTANTTLKHMHPHPANTTHSHTAHIPHTQRPHTDTAPMHTHSTHALPVCHDHRRVHLELHCACRCLWHRKVIVPGCAWEPSEVAQRAECRAWRCEYWRPVMRTLVPCCPSCPLPLLHWVLSRACLRVPFGAHFRLNMVLEASLGCPECPSRG